MAENHAFDNESYLQSLAASRADADRQIQNTLNEIARQRDVAYGQADQVGGKAQEVLQGVGNQYDKGVSGIQAALAAMLPADFLANKVASTSAEDAGVLHAGLRQHAAAFGRAGGLLRQGFDERSRTQTSQAQNIGRQVLADNDAQRAQYVARREAEDRDLWNRTVEANRQRELQERQLAQNAALQNQSLAHQSMLAAQGRGFDQWMAQSQMQHLATLASPPRPAPAPYRSRDNEHANLRDVAAPRRPAPRLTPLSGRS